jgi:hypothetical protein
LRKGYREFPRIKGRGCARPSRKVRAQLRAQLQRALKPELQAGDATDVEIMDYH